MPDKNVRIRFDTDADTSGAVAAENALERVTQEGASTETQVQELERAVELLNAELRENKGLSDSQAASLRKLRDGASGVATASRAAAKETKAGAKGTRNLGLAALEGSRAFEDMQHGLQGALNNIPSLILMLGGSAGLTAAISVAAVAGSILWGKLTSQSEEAEDAAAGYVDRIEEARKIMAEIGSEAQAEKWAAPIRALEENLRAIGWEQAVEPLKGALRESAIEAEKRLGIGEQELALIDAQARALALGGEAGTAAAEQELDTRRQIFALEQRAAQLRRESEIAQAERAKDLAAEQVAAIDSTLGKMRDEEARVKAELGRVDSELAEIFTGHSALVAEYRRELEEAREAYDQFYRDDIGKRSGARLDRIMDRLEAAKILLEGAQDRPPLADPTVQALNESQARLQAELDTLGEQIAGPADQLREAVRELARATLDASQLRQRDRLSREVESQQREIFERRQGSEQAGTDQVAAVEALGRFANDLGQEADVAPVVEAIKAAISDKALTLDELQDLQTVFGQYERQVGSLGRTMLESARQNAERLADLERQIRALLAQQGNKNF